MASNSTLKLKLLIQKNCQKVLLAEAGKDVVDFLFSLLALPIGTIIKLITKESMAGSLGETYGSLEQLDGTYLLSSPAKSELLNPTCSHFAVANNSLILPLSVSDVPTVTSKKYYKCPRNVCHPYPCNFHNITTEVYGTPCPICGCVMTEQVLFLPSPGAPIIKQEPFPGPPIIKEEQQNVEKGVVKGIVMFTITDDLSVMPMSAISSIALLNKFGVKDLSTVEEKTVSLGHQEGLELLKASLQSKNVLTDVFMTKKRRRV